MDNQDAEVGRLVMGYEGEPFHFCTHDGQAMSAWVDRRDGPWYTLRDLQEWLADHHSRGIHKELWIETQQRFPKYTTDPAADYSVLVKVRETWDQMRLLYFGAALDDLWARLHKMPLGCEMRQCGMRQLTYQPGDYSRAALAVLKAEASHA